jgi:hypothetical protein
LNYVFVSLIASVFGNTINLQRLRRSVSAYTCLKRMADVISEDEVIVCLK